MGCITHEYNGKKIRFGGDDVWCLCCFPDNYWDYDDVFDSSQLKTLAYFTIAIRLIDEGVYFGGYDTIYLPEDLPDNMRQAVDRAFKED